MKTSSLRSPHFLRNLEGTGPIQIRPDLEDPDSVLATFFPNQCLQYSLSDESVSTTYFAPSYLKQTSALMRDPVSRNLVAVVDNRKVLVWDGKETKLEKVTSIQTSQDISELLILTNQIVVVFTDGSLQTLKAVLDKIQPAAPEPKLTGKLVRSQVTETSDRVYVSQLIEGSDEKVVRTSLVIVDPEQESISLQHQKTIRLEESIVAFDFFSRDHTTDFVGLNKKGDITVQTLVPVRMTDPEESLIANIANEHDVVKSPVSLVQANLDHLAVRSNRQGGDGGIVSVVNVNFHMKIASVKTKTVTEKSGLMSCGANRLFFKHGNRVAKIDLSDSLPSTMADLIGSQVSLEGKVADGDIVSLKGMNGEEVEIEEVKTWKLENLGEISSELTVFRYVPEIIESGDLGKLEALLNSCQDIPEQLIVDIVVFLTKEERSSSGLLKLAFCLPVTETLLIDYLRTVEFKTAKKIIAEINELIKDADSDVFDNLITWGMLTLNAHYTNFLLSKDPDNVSLLSGFLSTVHSIQDNLESVSTLMPLTKMIMEGKTQRDRTTNRVYCIEVVQL